MFYNGSFFFFRRTFRDARVCLALGALLPQADIVIYTVQENDTVLSQTKCVVHTTIPITDFYHHINLMYINSTTTPGILHLPTQGI
jgi:hypothetical protein